jgi:hypothetical protein
MNELDGIVRQGAPLHLVGYVAGCPDPVQNASKVKIYGNKKRKTQKLVNLPWISPF